VLTLAAAFLPFAVVAGFTPGPNNLMLAASGANFGFRRTLPHLLGIVCGFPLVVLATGLGLGALFQRHPDVHAVMRFVGAAFLIYLAWRIATSDPGAPNTAPGRPLTFLEAALFQWVNIKGWVFAIGAITTYTTVGGRVSQELAVILTLSLLVTVGSTIAWTGFGVGLNRFLRRSSMMRRVFNVSMAVLLVLSIVPVLM
jgi:threonine/homoserine/homoserine lactone efflux protein